MPLMPIPEKPELRYFLLRVNTRDEEALRRSDFKRVFLELSHQIASPGASVYCFDSLGAITGVLADTTWRWGYAFMVVGMDVNVQQEKSYPARVVEGDYACEEPSQMKTIHFITGVRIVGCELVFIGREYTNPH